MQSLATFLKHLISVNWMVTNCIIREKITWESGCGLVERAVASDTGDPRFESSNLAILFPSTESSKKTK